MKVKFSNTVVLSLHPSIEHALNVVDRVWRKVTLKHPIVTGLGEEGHSETSLHYGVLGDVRTRAFDVRSSGLSEAQKVKIEDELEERLSTLEYDFVFEDNHLHIEFDPKP